MVPSQWKHLTEVLRPSEAGQEVCWRKGCFITVTCLHGYQHHRHALLAASVIYQIVRHVQPQILSSSKGASCHILFVVVH